MVVYHERTPSEIELVEAESRGESNGPGGSRTRIRAMRMPRSAIELQAQIYETSRFL